jgi:hypothetical protein
MNVKVNYGAYLVSLMETLSILCLDILGIIRVLSNQSGALNVESPFS